MPTERGFVLRSNVYLSNLTDMRDGVPFKFTTPYATLRSHVPMDSNLVMVVDIPAYTNRRPGAATVSVTQGTLTGVVQAVRGDPAQADGAWFDIAAFHTIKPFVPAGSTGAGTPANPVYSNRYRVAFQTPFTNVRFSGQAFGPNFDFSNIYIAVHPGTRRGRELD